MSDVQVTQEDREAAADWLEQEGLSNIGQATNIRLGHLDDNTLVQAFARHRLATRPAPVGEPVAWMYKANGSDEGFMQPNRANMDKRYWTETPLYTRPALDVDGLVEKVARAICCARSRCEGCKGHGEGSCFDLALWDVEAIAAIKDATDAGA